MNAADTYRRTLTSRAAEPTAWWYLGTTTFVAEGHPEIVVNHVETVMLYRAEPLEGAKVGGAFRVPWWEIGLFRDAITGEIASRWTNPLTGATVEAARTFEEGPSGYTIRPDGDGIALVDAVQAFAQLDKAELTVTESGGRVCVTQVEEKVRSFPGRDGIPDLDQGQGTRSRTVLQWFADAADLADDSPSVPATGLYSFTIGAPPWLGMDGRAGVFSVKGLMHKAPLAPALNPRGWADLKLLFPQYFDGDTILPRWG